MGRQSGRNPIEIKQKDKDREKYKSYSIDSRSETILKGILEKNNRES